MLSGLLKLAPSHNIQYGRIKVCLLNLGKGDAQDWIRRQKDVADIAVSAMGSPALGTWARRRFGKIRLIIFLRGRPRHTIVVSRVLFFIDPPLSTDLEKCVRYILSNVVLFSKRKENYFVNCLSKEASAECAMEYTRQALEKIDLAISCAIQEKEREKKGQSPKNEIE